MFRSIAESNWPAAEQPLHPEYNFTKGAQAVGERAMYGTDIPPTPYADQALAELDAFNKPIVEAAMSGMIDIVMDKATTYHAWTETARTTPDSRVRPNQVENVPNAPWVSALHADMTLFDPLTYSFTTVNAKYAYADNKSSMLVRDMTPSQDITPFQTERRDTPGYERSYRIDMEKSHVVSNYNNLKEQVVNPVVMEQWSTIIARSIPVDKDTLELADKLANAQNPYVGMPGGMVSSLVRERFSREEILQMKQELSEKIAKAKLQANEVRAQSQVQLSPAKPVRQIKK